jgi:hypothetical protein
MSFSPVFPIVQYIFYRSNQCLEDHVYTSSGSISTGVHYVFFWTNLHLEDYCSRTLLVLFSPVYGMCFYQSNLCPETTCGGLPILT